MCACGVPGPLGSVVLGSCRLVVVSRYRTPICELDYRLNHKHSTRDENSSLVQQSITGMRARGIMNEGMIERE